MVGTGKYFDVINDGGLNQINIYIKYYMSTCNTHIVYRHARIVYRFARIHALKQAYTFIGKSTHARNR